MCGEYAFVFSACVATKKGGCNDLVADMRRLESSQHEKDRAIRKMVDAHSRNTFGKTHTLAGGFGDDSVHVLAVDE